MTIFKPNNLAIACLALSLLAAPASVAQDSGEPTAWQVEKCRLYASAWQQALDGFGSDQLNYNFIAQNENFIASGCTAPASACPQSAQERQIADALTIAMMNSGAASTFLPFRCAEQHDPAVIPGSPASDGILCRSQLDLLLSGGKLTDAEAAVFDAQCTCLEQNDTTSADCAGEWK